jgi:hypothetical protein
MSALRRSAASSRPPRQEHSSGPKPVPERVARFLELKPTCSTERSCSSVRSGGRFSSFPFGQDECSHPTVHERRSYTRCTVQSAAFMVEPGWCVVLRSPRFTTSEPPETASEGLQRRTALRTRRSAAASRRTSSRQSPRCVQAAYPRGTARGRRRRCASPRRPTR